MEHYDLVYVRFEDRPEEELEEAFAAVEHIHSMDADGQELVACLESLKPTVDEQLQIPATAVSKWVVVERVHRRRAGFGM